MGGGWGAESTLFWGPVSIHLLLSISFRMPTFALKAAAQRGQLGSSPLGPQYKGWDHVLAKQGSA